MKKSKKILIGVISVFIILNVLDALFIGNVAYLIEWNRCGGRPYVVSQPVTIGFGASPVRTIATKNVGYLDGKKPLILNVGDLYMACTLDDVRAKFGPNFELNQ